MPKSLKTFLLAIFLPVSLLTFAPSAHAISIVWGKGEKLESKDMSGQRDLALDNLTAAINLHTTILASEPAERSQYSDNYGEMGESVRQTASNAGTFFGHYVRLYFQDAIAKKKFNEKELDEVTYSFMTAAQRLPYAAQRALVNSMRDQVKTLKFPAAASSSKERNLVKISLIYKAIVAAGTAGAIVHSPITFDLHPEYFKVIGGVALLPEAGYSIYRLLGFIRHVLVGMSGEEAQTIAQAEAVANKHYKNVALPSDCSKILLQEKDAASAANAQGI